MRTGDTTARMKEQQEMAMGFLPHPLSLKWLTINKNLRGE
jgi:hypothetical protein